MWILLRQLRRRCTIMWSRTASLAPGTRGGAPPYLCREGTNSLRESAAGILAAGQDHEQGQGQNGAERVAKRPVPVAVDAEPVPVAVHAEPVGKYSSDVNYEKGAWRFSGATCRRLPDTGPPKIIDSFRPQLKNKWHPAHSLGSERKLLSRCRWRTMAVVPKFVLTESRPRKVLKM